MPNVGDIEQGYKYVGGPPNQRASWIQEDPAIPIVPGHAADLSKEPRLPDPNTSFISANEGPPDFTDADGNLTMDGRKMMDDALSMAQMSSGIVKFSKGFKGKINAARKANPTQYAEVVPGQTFKMPNEPEIPVGNEIFRTHEDVVRAIRDEGDLFKSYNANTAKAYKRGKDHYFPQNYYIFEEGAVRGAGLGDYQTGDLTPDKFSYIKKNFNKNFRKNPDVESLTIETFLPKEGKSYIYDIPKGSVNSTTDETLGLFKVGEGGLNRVIDTIGQVKVKKADQLRSMINNFEKTGGSPEEYDAISELLESLINKRSGK